MSVDNFPSGWISGYVGRFFFISIIFFEYTSSKSLVCFISYSLIEEWFKIWWCMIFLNSITYSIEIWRSISLYHLHVQSCLFYYGFYHAPRSFLMMDCINLYGSRFYFCSLSCLLIFYISYSIVLLWDGYWRLLNDWIVHCICRDACL